MAIKIGKRKFQNKEDAVYYTAGLKKMTVQQAQTYVDELERRRKEKELQDANLKRLADLERAVKDREREKKRVDALQLKAVEEINRRDEEEARRIMTETKLAKKLRETEIVLAKLQSLQKKLIQQQKDDAQFKQYRAELKEKRVDEGIAAGAGLVKKRAKRQGAHAGWRGWARSRTWWKAEGAANCLVAYEAKNAPDYATSLINLVNPGLYDLATDDDAPSWDKATGWSFNGTSNYLQMKNTIGPILSGAATLIMRISTTASGTGEDFFGSAGGSALTLGWDTATQKQIMRVHTTAFDKSDNALALIENYTVGCTYTEDGAYTYYLNGSADGTGTNNQTVTGMTNRIGRRTTSYYNGYIIAAAIYETALSAAQMRTLTDEMGAL